MADVLSEFVSEAALEVEAYAKNSRTRPEEVLSMVQGTFAAKEVWRATGGSRGVPSPEVLFSFLRDILSTLNRTADSGSRQEAGTTNDARVLRDLRHNVAAECASLRRESEEQCSDQPANALYKLSWFLARCCEACESQKARSNASDLPLIGNLKRRTTMLRGMGNAILPQVAAAFIGAYLETQKEPPCKIN